GGDAEAVAEGGSRVDLTRGQLAGHQGRAQGVEDLAAHRGALHGGPGPRDGGLAVGVLAAYPVRGVGGVPVRDPGGIPRPGHSGVLGGPRRGGALRSLIHGLLLRTFRYLGSLRRVVTRPSSTISAR